MDFVHKLMFLIVTSFSVRIFTRVTGDTAFTVGDLKFTVSSAMVPYTQISASCASGGMYDLQLSQDSDFDALRLTVATVGSLRGAKIWINVNRSWSGSEWKYTWAPGAEVLRDKFVVQFSEPNLKGSSSCSEPDDLCIAMTMSYNSINLGAYLLVDECCGDSFHYMCDAYPPPEAATTTSTTVTSTSSRILVGDPTLIVYAIDEQKVTLECHTGKEVFENKKVYDWFLDGKKYNDFTQTDQLNVISLHNGAVYRSANISCIVGVVFDKDVLFSDHSNWVIIELFPAPTIYTQTAKISCNETVKLFCGIDASVDQYVRLYKWLFLNSTSITSVPGLFITHFTAEDVGNYSCAVNYTTDLFYSSVDLLLTLDYIPPTITWNFYPSNDSETDSFVEIRCVIEECGRIGGYHFEDTNGNGSTLHISSDDTIRFTIPEIEISSSSFIVKCAVLMNDYLSAWSEEVLINNFTVPERSKNPISVYNSVTSTIPTLQDSHITDPLTIDESNIISMSSQAAVSEQTESTTIILLTAGNFQGTISTTSASSVSPSIFTQDPVNIDDITSDSTTVSPSTFPPPIAVSTALWVKENDLVTLTCNWADSQTFLYSNETAFSYTWYRNGHVHVKESQNPSLEIKDFGDAFVGLYMCKITVNGIISPQSNTIHLNLEEQKQSSYWYDDFNKTPNLTSYSYSSVSGQYTIMSLSCSPSNLSVVDEYLIFSNGIVVFRSATENTYLYIMQPSNITNEGEYSCAVIIDGNISPVSDSLILSLPPPSTSNTDQTTTDQTRTDQNSTFHTGTEQTWTDQTDIVQTSSDQTVSDKFIEQNVSSDSTEAVSPSQLLSTTQLTHVLSKPVLTSSHSTTYAGNSLTFTCRSSRNDVSEFFIIKSETEPVEMYNGALNHVTVPNLEVAHTGNYTCFFRTQSGNTSDISDVMYVRVVPLGVLCPCSCPDGVLNVTPNAAVLEEMTSSIKNNLSVNVEALSATIRKHVSITDDRKSSTGLGTIAIAIICVLLLLIISFDLLSVGRAIVIIPTRAGNSLGNFGDIVRLKGKMPKRKHF